MWIMDCGIALWAVGAILFLKPAIVWLGILGVGGVNLILLELFDGTIQLVSKLCFWCLFLTVLFVTEPYWFPKPAHSPAAAPKRTTQHTASDEDDELASKLCKLPAADEGPRTLQARRAGLCGLQSRQYQDLGSSGHAFFTRAGYVGAAVTTVPGS